MSVEIVGAGGYDYQDFVSLFAAMVLIEKEDVEIKIENPNGEDCEIKYKIDGQEYIIDIQVKNRSNFIEINEFSEWISHFEKHNTEQHLMLKLQRDKNRFVLFVTNNRVENDLINFCSLIEDELHIVSDKSFNNKIISNIKDGINKVENSNTPLSIKRKKSLSDFCLENNPNKFRGIFKKIKIWEMKEYDLLREELQSIFNKKYLVPKSRINELIYELINIIKDNKGNNLSITEKIKVVLGKYNEQLVFKEGLNYIESQEYNQYCDTLENNNVLLLSGMSMCGKTYTARKIASNLQKEGYFCLLTSDSLEALNFIMKNDTEEKILILEDPYGAIIPKIDSIEIHKNIKDICREANKNKKVIFTSRSDILINTLNKRTLDECNIDRNAWFDLTIKDVNLMEKLWECHYSTSEKSKKIFNELILHLRDYSGDDLLQLGELNHLIHNMNFKELESSDMMSIINTARVNSQDLANIIYNNTKQEFKQVFIALTLCCNTNTPIDFIHLHYVLSESQVFYSLRNEKDSLGTSINFIDRDDEVEENESLIKWKYNDEHNKIPKNEYTEVIRYFLKCGYINITPQGMMFTHPVYQHAGFILLVKELELGYYSDSFYYDMMKRGIAATSKQVNMSTVKLLEFCYENIKSKEILDIILMGWHSIFPAVIDRCTMFILNRFNDFEDSLKDEAINVLMENKENKEVINWYDGEPFILNKNLSFRRFLDNLLLNKSSSEIDYIVDFQNSKEVWEALNVNFKEEKRIEYLEFLKKAIYHDEIFIRELAYYKLFKYYIHDDFEIFSLIKFNNHPSVIYKSFIGAMYSWGKYSSENKEKLIEVFKSTLVKVPVAIRFLRFLENFQDEYITDGINWSDLTEEAKQDLWKVWYEIFITIFKNFPFDFRRMHEPHLVLVADNSLEYVTDVNLIVQLATEWHNWLNVLIENKLPDDYGMSVASYLMKGTRHNSEVRKNLFSQFLKDSKTSLITTHLSHFIRNWNYLSGEEIDQIKKLIHMDRKDIVWIKSMLLTGDSIPEEIQLEIFNEIITNKPVNYITTKLKENDLLESCLNIYTGYPQPLWWNGYHHNNFELWNEIIVDVLLSNEIDFSFKLATKEFVDKLYNKSSNYKKNLEIYRRILDDKDRAKLLFEELILVSATQNQSNKQLWDEFSQKEYFTEDPFYLNLILENIEALQYQQLGEKGFLEYLEWDFIYRNLIPYIDNEMRFIELIYLIEQGDNPTVTGEFGEVTILDLLKIHLEFTPPQLSIVNKIIKIKLEKLGVLTKDILHILENNRNKYSVEGYKKVRAIKEDYDLKDWIK